MKVKNITMLFAMLVVALLTGACGGDEAKKVASKIDGGDKLTEKDYTVMIDYCGKYAEDAQRLQDKINVLSPTSEEAGKLTDKVAELSGKFPLASKFFEAISNSTEQEVGAENVKRINKLAALTWFVAPEWADAGDNSDVVGDIVEMPDSDTAGVISAGDGEAVK